MRHNHPALLTVGVLLLAATASANPVCMRSPPPDGVYGFGPDRALCQESGDAALCDFHMLDTRLYVVDGCIASSAGDAGRGRLNLPPHEAVDARDRLVVSWSDGAHIPAGWTLTYTHEGDGIIAVQPARRSSTGKLAHGASFELDTLARWRHLGPSFVIKRLRTGPTAASRAALSRLVMLEAAHWSCEILSEVLDGKHGDRARLYAAGRVSNPCLRPALERAVHTPAAGQAVQSLVRLGAELEEVVEYLAHTVEAGDYDGVFATVKWLREHGWKPSEKVRDAMFAIVWTGNDGARTMARHVLHDLYGTAAHVDWMMAQVLARVPDRSPADCKARGALLRLSRMRAKLVQLQADALAPTFKTLLQPGICASARHLAMLYLSDQLERSWTAPDAAWTLYGHHLARDPSAIVRNVARFRFRGEMACDATPKGSSARVAVIKVLKDRRCGRK